MAVHLPAGWPYARAPTVHDLAVRHCFICAEDDTSRSKPAVGWVHPCKCTLVVHESCLLRWIDSSSPAQRESRMKCSSCGSEYHITRIPSRTLGIIRRVDRLVARAGGMWFTGSALSVGLGIAFSIYSVGVSYGYVSSRLLLGSKLCDHIMPLEDDAGTWPLSAVYQLPSLSVIMFKILHPGVFPSLSLLAEIGFGLPPSLRPLRVGEVDSITSYGRRLFARWPPHPRFLSILFPTASYCYMGGYAWLRRRLVETWIPAENARDTANEYLARQMIQADGDNYLRVRREAGEDRADNPAVEVVMGNAVDADVARGWLTIPLGRVLMGVSLLPAVIAGIGRALRWLSLSGSWMKPLRIFLAARPDNAMDIDAVLGWRTPHWTDFEPVWWHSIVGCCLFIVGRDVYQLARESLLLRDFYNRQITDFPFTNVEMGEDAFVVDESADVQVAA